MPHQQRRNNEPDRVRRREAEDDGGLLQRERDRAPDGDQGGRQGMVARWL